ncbi:hypothetical protein JXL83_06175 [candidate division WOR-3 bacterium]|nr:hypothetical protein [candidate division WOR-3 bacterium]
MFFGSELSGQKADEFSGDDSNEFLEADDFEDGRKKRVKIRDRKTSDEFPYESKWKKMSADKRRKKKNFKKKH